MTLLAIAFMVHKIRSLGQESGKSPADAASGRAEAPKPSRLRPISGAELGSRERRKPRPTRAELPDDPRQIKELTPELAKLLVAKFKGRRLDLSGLTTLDADTAKTASCLFAPRLLLFRSLWLRSGPVSPELEDGIVTVSMDEVLAFSKPQDS
jgi:hypothetical protein